MGLCFSGLVALQTGKPFRLLLHPALRQVGNVSYSIYILHFAVCALLVGLPYGFSPLRYLPDEPFLRFSIAFAGVFAISYLLAHLTRVLIELPFIALGRHLSSRYMLRLPDKTYDAATRF